MTEDEAKTKWCPFVRTDAQGPENSACNRYDGTWSSNALLCIGSACMGWRWYRTHITNPDAPKGDLIVSTRTHGFCGMAGPWHQGADR